MGIKNYDEITELEKDVMKEIGSIGIGNAATSLSTFLGTQVRMTVPSVQILDYDDAIALVGDPEDIVTATLVSLSGDKCGVMLFLQKLEFVQTILSVTCGSQINKFEDLSEMDKSALVEIGNIMISSYAMAVTQLTGESIELSVPSIAVDMLGAIMSVPMAVLGYQANKIMVIKGQLNSEGIDVPSEFLMLPDVATLNLIVEKLGITHE